MTKAFAIWLGLLLLAVLNGLLREHLLAQLKPLRGNLCLLVLFISLIAPWLAAR